MIMPQDEQDDPGEKRGDTLDFIEVEGFAVDDNRGRKRPPCRLPKIGSDDTPGAEPRCGVDGDTWKNAMRKSFSTRAQKPGSSRFTLDRGSARKTAPPCSAP